MELENFRIHGKEMVDYICDYLTSIKDRPVIANVTPGYLRSLLPSEAPENPEKWEKIVQDVERCIMPGVTHWQHPQFHAYFPSGNSFPSILGDMLSSAIACIGFSWAGSPACTELEIVVLDWVAKMVNLPEKFMHTSNQGGGVLQSSSSDCVLVTMLAARHKTMMSIQQASPLVKKSEICDNLVGYCSQLAHSCVEKAGMLSLVHIRHLDVDDDCSLRGATLLAAIQRDIENGLIPFYVCATLGTTSCCSFDNLSEIGEICRKYGIWLHVDAAYAGSSFMCPELRGPLKGVENANSLSLNANKWMLVNFDCSCLWTSEKATLIDAMTVDPLYLRHKHADKAVDFRHWGIPLSRRFRSLKIWFVLRSYGVSNLQKYIREHIRLANLFASLVEQNEKFQLFGKVRLGLACFRFLNSNGSTKQLLHVINESGKLHMIPASVRDQYFIRFAVCREQACEEDVYYAWHMIQKFGDEIIESNNNIYSWSMNEPLQVDGDLNGDLSAFEEDDLSVCSDSMDFLGNQMSQFSFNEMKTDEMLNVENAAAYSPRLKSSDRNDNSTNVQFFGKRFFLTPPPVLRQRAAPQSDFYLTEVNQCCCMNGKNVASCDGACKVHQPKLSRYL